MEIVSTFWGSICDGIRIDGGRRCAWPPAPTPTPNPMIDKIRPRRLEFHFGSGWIGRFRGSFARVGKLYGGCYPVVAGEIDFSLAKVNVTKASGFN